MVPSLSPAKPDSLQSHSLHYRAGVALESPGVGCRKQVLKGGSCPLLLLFLAEPGTPRGHSLWLGWGRSGFLGARIS